MSNLILSIFPGIDMLGEAFEQIGFCVVRGPDPLWGGDIRSFHVPAGRFDGVIGGPPCQDFSAARRTAPTGHGVSMLGEYQRVVLDAQPDWWLLENVSRVPSVEIDGYTMQRFDLNARECGSPQSRLRHFQFGSRGDLTVIPERTPPSGEARTICLATEGARKDRRTWGDFCAAQGLPRTFDLPGLSIEAKYRAVGNGVPLPMGRVVARAILDSVNRRSLGIVDTARLCVCGCGRPLLGERRTQRSATPACRKRLQKRRALRLASLAQGPVVERSTERSRRSLVEDP